MSKIRLLSNEVIGKIAAGEVVESPAAIVKELLENSLDAKSTSIQIEIKAGGFQLIRIEDNGIGMDKEDALLSIHRHTTSKIFSADDLYSLDTMGFRGEALASISAVSKLKLHTSDGIEATVLEIEGGMVVSVERGARERGSMVEVRSLFFNTPARKAFQKGVSASTAEIIRLLIAMSLSHPNVDFQLISERDVLLKTLKVETTDAERLLSFRVQNVLGENFLSKAFWIKVQNPSYSLSGFIGFPEFVRPNRLGQYLFLNRRWVQSPLISSWVKEAYSTRIREGTFPHFVLHIEMPKEHLDVNVHPQKREVKIKEGSELKSLLQKAIIDTLSPVKEELSLPSSSFTHQPFSFREDPDSQIREWEKKTYQEASLPFTPLAAKCPRVLSLINPYLLVQGEEVSVVDLPAAYAKCLFETLLNRSAKEQNASNLLLLPLTLQLSKEEVFRFLEEEEFLLSAGFQIRALGEYTLAIDSYPALLQERDVLKFLQALMMEERDLFMEKRNRLAHLCSRFAKTRSSFSLEEAEKILEKLLTLPSFLFCPLGKKTFHSLQIKDLAQFFA